MSGSQAGAPPGDGAPPTPPATTGNGAGAHAVATHAIAEATAQAAAEQRVRPPTAVARAPADYTGLVTRAIAFGIDALLINVVAIVVAGIVSLALGLLQHPAKLDHVLAAIGAVVFLVWAAAYFVTFWSTTGQTPGARIMRFRVLAPGADRGRVTPRRAVVRLVGMILAALPLLAGYLMVLVDDRRRGLHDRIAATVVTDAPDTETLVRRRQPRPRAPVTR